MSHSIQHYSSTWCLAEQSVDLKSDFFFYLFIFIAFGLCILLRWLRLSSNFPHLLK